MNERAAHHRPALARELLGRPAAFTLPPCNGERLLVYGWALVEGGPRRLYMDAVAGALAYVIDTPLKSPEVYAAPDTELLHQAVERSFMGVRESEWQKYLTTMLAATARWPYLAVDAPWIADTTVPLGSIHHWRTS